MTTYRLSRRQFSRLLAAGAASTLLPLVTRASSADPTGIAQDQDRPEYHLLAPHNWINDPNGPIYWRGQYHLFYQLNPGAAVWGDMHWGHAVSADMIHWRHRSIALAPTPGGPDSAGCFTGSAVVFNGKPTLIYTGIALAPLAEATIRDGDPKYRETQLLATATDNSLDHWQKRPEPVIAVPPAGMQVTGFRDPCPWREADGWYTIVGSGEPKKGGRALLYRSPDLIHWEYLHPLAEGHWSGKDSPDPNQTGEMWECPDFFEVNGRWCLIHSSEGRVYWNTGEYDQKEHRFHIARTGLIDQGSCYAPKSFLASGNRRILWGWIQEARPEAEHARAGWAGAITLPRQLSIGPQGQLEVAIAREAESLRGPRQQARITQEKPFSLPLATLRQELKLPVSLFGGAVSLRLRQADEIKWELAIDPKQNPPRNQVQYPSRAGARGFALPAEPWPRPHLHLFLDGSIIEAFIGGRESLTARVYGLKAGQAQLEIALTGPGHLDLELWPLNPISPDRLTST